MVSNEYIKELEQRSSVGELLEHFLSSGAYDVLDNHILKPLEHGAFETFTKVNPNEAAEIIQAQMMWKVIQQIRGRIGTAIAEGNLARENLKHSTQTDE